MSDQQSGAWDVEGSQTYRLKHFWTIWKPNPNVYGGRQYRLNASRTDRKRYYDETKAKAEAERLNSIERAAANGSKAD